MNRLMVTFTLCGTLMGAYQGDEKQRVVVYVDGAILAPPGVFEQARLAASQMFAAIGIQVRWKTGTPHREGKDQATECGPGYVPVIGVKMCSTTPRSEIPGAIASALPFSHAATRIDIFYDRIELLLRMQRGLTRPLLAHVLVHEITHVLQGIDWHSQTGVMKAAWSHQDHNVMESGPLAFTADDVALIYQGIAGQAARSGCRFPADIRPAGAIMAASSERK